MATAENSIRWLIGSLLVVVVGAFTLVPVLYIAVHSFNVADIGAPFKWGTSGWTDVLSSSRTLNSIAYSFLLAVRIPIGIVIAVLVAWLLVRVQIPCNRFIERSLWFTLFLPTIPITMGWILLLDPGYGLINQALKLLPFKGPTLSIYSVTGIIWVHITMSTIPIMVILLTPALRQFDGSLEEAAHASGAGTFTTLRRVTLPLVAPAILIAFIAGLIRSLQVFEIEQLLGAPVNISVYATRIFDLVKWYPPQYPEAMALSTLFLGVLLVIAFFYQLTSRYISNSPTMSGKGIRIRPPSRTIWAYLASALLIAYLFVSVCLPLIVLVFASCTRLFGFFFIDHPWTLVHWSEVLSAPPFLRSVVVTIALGLIAALVGTAIFTLLAWTLVRTNLPGRTAINFLTWLPWAVPGIVLGIGLLSLMLQTPVVSMIYGTTIPLVLAIVIKEMPIGVQMLKTAVMQVSGEMEEAARAAGAAPFTAIRRIVLPLIAPMLVAIFLLVFMSMTVDISTVVLLATPGLQTLSLLMFEFATASHIESAAVVGVLIAIITFLVSSCTFYIGTRTGFIIR
jgi:iron(III) transport system permease protein